MAVAVAIGTILTTDPSGGVDKTRSRINVSGTLTLTGNYGSASSNGDTINFALPQIQTASLPEEVTIWENVGSSAAGVGNTPLGYVYNYVQGTTLANGLLQVVGTPSSGGALVGGLQFTPGNAYSTGTPSLSGAVLKFRATFLQGV